MKYKKKYQDGIELKFEDFTFDEADVTSSGIQKLITKDIIHDLEPMLVGKQILEEDTKLVGKPGRIRTYRKAAPMSDARDFNAGDDVPPVLTPEVFSTVDSIPTKFGHSEIVYEDAIDAMDINAVVETEHALAAGMARKSDSRVWNEVLQATVVTGEVLSAATGTAKRFALDHDKVLEITTLTADYGAGPVAQTIGVDFYVDFFRGRIEFVTAPTVGNPNCDYIYSDLTNALEVVSVKRFGRDDVVNGKTKIRSSCYGKGNTCVLNENEMNDLEKDDRFTDADRYGSNAVLMNGEIGKTAGVNFLVSERMYEGIAFVCQKGGRLGKYTYKKKPVAKVEEMEAKSGDLRVKTWEKSQPTLVNELFGCGLFNAHQYAKAIKSGYI